jgi:hypothetical protein
MGEAKSKALARRQVAISVPVGPVALDTFAGKIHVEWDPAAAVTPLGQLPFFIEFLKVSGLFDRWVEDCPLAYESNNAPEKREVLGTLLLSILAGHYRYAHITSVRMDGVNPGLLGMRRVVSEDTVRRALIRIDEKVGLRWLERGLQACYEALLLTPWILDADTTVKPLYGKQEGAVLGYNPKKPGRPAHVYHSYLMANTRLVMNVEVMPGNKTAGSHSAAGLFELVERLPSGQRPAFLRGDVSFGVEAVMARAEAIGLPYLFKLRLTQNVKRLIEKVFAQPDWEAAGQGWSGVEERLQLSGWSCARRVVVLRREVRGELALARKDEDQLRLAFIEAEGPVARYEYAVLVTSLPDPVRALAQHYRDRGDCENHFDELKNQWGWSGYTTKDLKRCRLISRMVALIYNWWSLFVRLAHPDQHLEAITSRPLLLHAVAKQTQHAGQTRVTITSTHALRAHTQRALCALTGFLKRLGETAEQLTEAQRWYRILNHAFRILLRGRQLTPPNLLLQAAPN